MLRQWNRFWFDPSPPTTLGVCRALSMAVICYVFGMLDFSRFSELGPASAFWEPLWLFKSLHLPVLGAGALTALQIVWRVSLVLSCVGWFTDYSKWISFVLGFYLLAITFNYGKVEHQTMPVVLTMGILALSRCGDGFSIDALFRARRKRTPPPSGEYRWPIRAVWLLMSIMFCTAGIAKLRYTGIRWALGPAFSTLLIKEFYDVRPPLVTWGLFIANHPLLSHIMASSSLLAELSFPLTLFNRRARALLPMTTFLMQIGIGLLMNVWFLQFLVLYVFWVPWGRLLRREQTTFAPRMA